MLRLIALFFCLFFCSPLMAEQVVVAVASNFLTPMQQLEKTFEKQYPHKLTLVSGSSGKLYAQIVHGAPFDLFLSADSEKPTLLEQKALTVKGSRYTYARGRLVLWSAKQSINVGQILHQPVALALANASVAPYGKAAMEVLDRLQVDRNALKRLVRGENVSQVYQYVSSGSVDAGFIALSQLPSTSTETDYWLIPEHLYQPIEQQMVLLKRAKSNPAAQAFLRFMRSPETQAWVKVLGYQSASAEVLP